MCFRDSSGLLCLRRHEKYSAFIENASFRNISLSVILGNEKFCFLYNMFALMFRKGEAQFLQGGQSEFKRPKCLKDIFLVMERFYLMQWPKVLPKNYKCMFDVQET